jgi:hypothetical protein
MFLVAVLDACIQSARQYAIPAFGIGVRWLKEELRSRGVSVRLTEACLRELVMDADAAARLEVASRDAIEPTGAVEARRQESEPYAARLRRQIAARAEFLRAWTRSDAPIQVTDPSIQRLMSIARKYALPRAWTLSEPMAATARNPTPTYLKWASAR